MDGAASVIAVIQLVERVGTLCSKYIKAVKNAKSDIERLQGELDRLRIILKDADELLQGPNAARLQTSQRFNGKLKECSLELNNLENKLKLKLDTGKQGKFMTRLRLHASKLKWPFESEDVNGLTRSLKRFQDELSASLNVDQTRLLLDNIERVDSEERRKILEWVSPILYVNHHNTVNEARTPGTCEWLLKNEKFQKWEDTSSSTILWLQGLPGAGKTFLTSKVIDHAQSLLEQSPNQEGFAFFYCNRNEEERHKPLCVLRSYVRQLSTAASHPTEMRKKLRGVWHQMSQRGSELGFEACKEQLLQSVNLYQKTTLVLDALDECDSDSRRQLADTIEFLLSKSERPLKVFISSRPCRDIQNRFRDKSNIEIQAAYNENDIRKFVDENIVKHEEWKDMAPRLQDDIISALLNVSEGMFQWASLQIKQILDLKTEAAIRDRLGKLPTTLKATYDEMYKKITGSHEHDRVIAERALKWVMCAREPLSTVELLSAIRLDSENDVFLLSEKITESLLLNMCNNLLLLDSQRNTWRFSHLSVVEYFEQNHWTRLQAHCHGAKVCLKFLIETYKEPRESKFEGESNDLGDKPNDKSETGDVFDSKHPFQVYTRHHWIAHIQEQEGQRRDALLASLLKRFLGSLEESSLQYQQWHRQLVSDGYEISDSSCFYGTVEEISPATASIFLVCRFSLYTLLSDWWTDKTIKLSPTNRTGYDLLTLAAAGGSRPICEVLLQQEKQVNISLQSGKYGSALAAAGFWGRVEIVKFLVQEGKADVNMPLESGNYGSALAAAAAGGEVEIVKFLVQEGKADVNMPLQSGYYGSALAAAAARGEVEIVKFLVQEGKADVNMPLESGNYGSALAAAAAEGEVEIVKFLVQEGKADVNMPLQSGDYGSALAAAAYRGRVETVKFLVQEGKADVNMPLQSGDYGSALAAAAAGGRVETVKFLVQEGKADVNMPLESGNYGSALAAAAAGGKVEIINHSIFPSSQTTTSFLLQSDIISKSFE
ncbi:hypothetical protein QBC38DRAFT_163141 [Podospora fimiseda]|uniref:NACHT domain-containing protein n=1 Tax=Podospora fimiseda TaxID=252190 RepID=A0AAN7BEW6_9PEZI|nr:hypothetical protein QBC38DRAFT_163141 [Podospora fimiseda]